MGDTFFNGFYPVIDTSTGRKVNGMIVAAEKILSLADDNTKIVPGHGPLGNKADLTKSREMLVVARDRVQKLKTAGKSAEEIAGGFGPRVGPHAQQRRLRADDFFSTLVRTQRVV